MTDLRKAAEMALYALELNTGYGFDPVIEALRQALAQPEQEPVAWLYQTAYGDKFIHKKEQAAFHEPNGTFTPLYTAPPKREWVGLTDEEKEKYVVAYFVDKYDRETATTLMDDYEAVLKEKNT